MLQVKTPTGEVRNIALDRPLRLGRDGVCELFFPDDGGLSRQHMVIEATNGRWAVRDLSSKNGTFLNGDRLTAEVPLKPGDNIQASKVQLIYEPGSARQPREAVQFENIEMATTVPQGTVVVSLKDIIGAAETSRHEQPKATQDSRQWDTPVQALLRAGRELVGGRPLNELFRVILDLALEAVTAERGALFTFEGDQLVLQVSSGGEFKISSMVREKVLREGSSLLIQNVMEDAMLQNRESIILQGIRSLMAVPLQTEEKVIGMIYVDGNTFRRQFKTADLSLLTVMANVAAIRIERARLALVEEAEQKMRMEVDQAAEIQRRHLPSRAPDLPCFEISGENSSCRTVGGDYYDYLQLADGRTALLVADVAGKGLPAALMMMNLQANANAIAESCSNLADFASRLNRALIKHCPRNRFVTMFVCAIDPCGTTLHYCNAGHNPALWITASGEVRTLEKGGPVLGLLPRVSYEEDSITLSGGDQLVMYSDGITEAENPDELEFDVNHLAAAVQASRHLPAKEMIDTIFQLVTEWTQGAPASDDRTIVVARRLVT